MKRQYLSNGKCILAMVVVIALMFGAVAQASVSLPPMTLTIVGSSGSSLVLHEGDIGSYPSYRAYGGYKNSLGILKGLGFYTGVRINTFCDQVGGLHSSQTLRVTAGDGYIMNFTYAQVNGDFVTYNNVTGQQVQHNQPLTTILAYFFNDINLTSGGPLRLAIVGPEGLCTDSKYWVQNVIKLEMLGQAVGGYVNQIDTIGLLAPWITLASIVTVATASVIASIVYLRRRRRQQN